MNSDKLSTGAGLWPTHEQHNKLQMANPTVKELTNLLALAPTAM
jgi:hypothetical protein